jgi:hypothetical protein
LGILDLIGIFVLAYHDLPAMNRMFFPQGTP